jgi:hypothetical protein
VWCNLASEALMAHPASRRGTGHDAQCAAEVSISPRKALLSAAENSGGHVQWDTTSRKLCGLVFEGGPGLCGLLWYRNEAIEKSTVTSSNQKAEPQAGGCSGSGTTTVTGGHVDELHILYLPMSCTEVKDMQLK